MNHDHVLSPKRNVS